MIRNSNSGPRPGRSDQYNGKPVKVHIDIGLGLLCGRTSMFVTDDPLRATCAKCTRLFEEIRERESPDELPQPFHTLRKID